MKDQRNQRAKRSLISFGVASLLTVAAATAQVTSGTTGIDASGSFAQEVQACNTGKTQQDRETCLKEARNAQADKKRGLLDNSGSPQANATARCEVLSGEDKAACLARMMGYGGTSGSVAGGGVIREVETVVLPQGTGSITVERQTNTDPVVLVPAK